MGLVLAAWIGCIAGLVVVTGTLGSVVGTLVVPRRVDSRLSRVCEYLVDGTFRATIPRGVEYETRDRVLAWQAPITLLVRLLVWLTLLALGFGLVLLPAVLGSPARAFSDAGSSLFTLGYAAPTGRASAVLEYLAAFTGLVVVGLQVGYLPTLYAAFNRRETAVSLLAARAGSPAWGPEILARTKWGIFDGDTRPVLDELFSSWESWAAEVAESHTTYFTLARLRSPQPFSDWLTSLVAVLDAAALHLSLTPSAEPKITARLSLRMGFETLDRIARAMRLPVPAGPDPDAPISVSYDQFCAATAMLRQLDYPIEVTDEVAWPNFRGWRANYDITALLLARELDATPAMWTGTRRWPSEPIPPRRPALRKTGGASPRREPPRAP
jgi:hypothetical protein